MRGAVNAVLTPVKAAVARARWAIAIYLGDDPLSLAPAPRIPTPVLTRHSVTDAFASFVADPFMIRVDGTWHMFFEALTIRRGVRVGVICHATSPDGLGWAYRRVVLEEPFHVSYPQVLRHGGDFFMIPETREAGAVRLYRADPFPRRWVHVSDLLTGPTYFDSTVFEREGRWWMLTETSPRSDTLRLLSAPALAGPWREHPRSPVVNGNPRTSRPAGRLLSFSGRLIRFAQDCVPAYGSAIRAFEITRLTPQDYEEREIEPAPLLGPGRGLWNRRGMHQIDVHPYGDGRWIACVDGWFRGLVGVDEIVHRVRGCIS